VIDFLWWPTLLFLLVIPVFSIIYQIRQGRYKKRLAEFNYRPFNQGSAILFFLALTVMILGAARPTYVVRHPISEITVILAIDASGSMEEDDMHPTRLGAAKLASIDFIQRLGTNTRVGVMAFSETTALMQAPTFDRDKVADAINRMYTGSGTAIGNAIIDSVSAVGKNKGVIVLISDGQSNTGIKPLDALEMAKQQGIRIFTVGIGTHRARALSNALDEETLIKIATETGGTYHRASEMNSIKEALRDIAPSIAWVAEKTEITFALSGTAIILLIGSLKCV
jgi:Ca-activated chloride channel family protein